MSARSLALLITAALASAQVPIDSEVASGSRRSRSISEELAHASTDERIHAYERILNSSGNDLQTELSLVSAYLQKVRESSDRGYLDRASKIIDKILDSDAANNTAFRLKNEIDLQRHNFVEVAERAESIARYDPSDAGNWGNLGDASMDLGHYVRAGEAYRRMFALRADLTSYNRLAYFRFVTGDADGAMALMHNAIDAGSPMPENVAWCWAELGDMQFKIGRVSEARKSYGSALELFPALHRAIAGLGRLDATQGNFQGAIKLYERAQAIVPLVEYAAALEDLYTSIGNRQKARSQRELVDTIDQLGKAGGEKTNRNLTLLLADHNRNLGRATELIEAELPIRGDVYTWDAYSWVLYKGKRLNEAAVASQKALKLSTPEPSFYYHASKIAESLHNEQASIEFRKRLNSLNPKFQVTAASKQQ